MERPIGAVVDGLPACGRPGRGFMATMGQALRSRVESSVVPTSERGREEGKA